MNARTRLLVVAAVVVSVGGCTGSPTEPSSTAPPVQVPSTPAAPAPAPPPDSTATDFSPPHARLVITADGRHMPAVVNASAVLFDASESTGEGLTYRIEFGDGHDIFARQAEHIPSGYYFSQTLIARLTVTDRFGRVAVDEAPYQVVSVFTGNQSGYDEFWVGDAAIYTPANVVVWLYVNKICDGVQCGHFMKQYSPGGETDYGQLTGSTPGGRELHFQLSDGTTLDGQIILSDYRGAVTSFDQSLSLTVHGGQRDGLLLRFIKTAPF